MASWYDVHVKEYDGIYTPIMLAKEKGTTPVTLSEPNYVNFGKIAVTKNCKDKQALTDLIDMCFTEEYATLDFYGIEDVSHTVQDGIKVFKSNFKDKEFYEKQATGTQLWFKTGMPINHLSTQEGYLMGDLEPQKTIRTKFSEKYCLDGKYYFYRDYMMAPPTVEEAQKLAEISNDIKTYSTETLTKLCLGLYDISTIDEHINTLKKLGLEEMIAIYQARHDRFMSAK